MRQHDDAAGVEFLPLPLPLLLLALLLLPPAGLPPTCRLPWLPAAACRAGQAPEVKAIHAGLECGIIGEKLPGLEAVSYGPTIT